MCYLVIMQSKLAFGSKLSSPFQILPMNSFPVLRPKIFCLGLSSSGFRCCSPATKPLKLKIKTKPLSFILKLNLLKLILRQTSQVSTEIKALEPNQQQNL